VRDGLPSAPVKLVEFGDFQCPFCGRFAPLLDSTKAEFGDSVELVFVHLPIPSHRLAIPLARASECAAAQGRFDEFYHVALYNQDSLGAWSWQHVAELSKAADTSGFARCVASTNVFPRLAAGPAIAHDFGITGTPTIVVNGWRFYSPPSRAELSTTITALLRKQTPFPNSGLRSWLRTHLGSSSASSN
jgi:protein-disulfide isomerase